MCKVVKWLLCRHCSRSTRHAFPWQTAGLHRLSSHCHLNSLRGAFSSPRYTSTTCVFPVLFVKGVFAAGDSPGPIVQPAEHRTEGLSDWTHWRWRSSQGGSGSTPSRTEAGQTHCSLFAVTEDFTLLSPTDGSSLCSAATGNCAGVHSNSHSPFYSHSTSFQAIRRSSLAQKLLLLFPSAQDPISVRNSFQLRWSSFTLHFKHWLKVLCFL